MFPTVCILKIRTELTTQIRQPELFMLVKPWWSKLVYSIDKALEGSGFTLLGLPLYLLDLSPIGNNFKQ
jgi:hypothetical protein